MSNGFWDDPAVKPPSATYAKFEDPGDCVEGTISALSKRVFNPGTSDERVAPEFTFAEDDAPQLTASQTLLQSGLYKLRPVVGDHLRAELVQVERRGEKTLKRFLITVTRADGTIATIDQTA